MKKGIKARLIILLLLMITALFSIFVVFLNLRLRRISRSEIEGTVQQGGEVAAQLVRSPLFYADYPKLVDAMHPLLSNYFDYFLVYDTISGNVAFLQDSGNVLPAEYALKFRAAQDFEKKSRQDITLHGKEYVEFVFPAFVSGVKTAIGLVIIGISQKKVNDQLFPITLWIVAMGVVTVILVLLAAYFIAQRFIAPLQRLTQTMSDFSAGDTSARSGIEREDEIGILSSSFNQMANRITEQIASIETYSRDLEKMVDERSRKLFAALSELREKDIKIEQAKRIRSLTAMVNAIAHQINNPMAIISGHVQMLTTGNRDEAVARRLQSIDKAIDRIDGLIRDIAFYLSLHDIHLEQRTLRDLVLAIGRELIPPSVQADYIGFESPEQPVAINIDLMSIALRHIIRNALEAVADSKNGKRIRFRLQRQEEWLSLDIEDNGPGVSDPEHVFDPFFSAAPEKSGLGLTFAYQIVQIHDGEISIANTGSGARVTIRLPLTKADS